MVCIVAIPAALGFGYFLGTIIIIIPLLLEISHKMLLRKNTNGAGSNYYKVSVQITGKYDAEGRRVLVPADDVTSLCTIPLTC